MKFKMSKKRKILYSSLALASVLVASGTSVLCQQADMIETKAVLSPNILDYIVDVSYSYDEQSLVNDSQFAVMVDDSMMVDIDSSWSLDLASSDGGYAVFPISYEFAFNPARRQISNVSNVRLYVASLSQDAIQDYSMEWQFDYVAGSVMRPQFFNTYAYNDDEAMTMFAWYGAYALNATLTSNLRLSVDVSNSVYAYDDSGSSIPAVLDYSSVTSAINRRLRDDVDMLCALASDNTDLAYMEGRRDGYDVGYSLGFDEGYSFGYSTGKVDADSNEYDKGYLDGLSHGSTAVGPITAIFMGISSVPINILNGLGGFTIYDVPVISVLLSLMFITLIAWLIRRFI